MSLLFSSLFLSLMLRLRGKSAHTNLLDVFTMFPYIVPGSILGIALLISFNQKPLVLSGTAIIMIVAFVIRRLPYTIRSSAAVLHQVNDSIRGSLDQFGCLDHENVLQNHATYDDIRGYSGSDFKLDYDYYGVKHIDYSVYR